MVETHTATLFFVGDRVYKLKKALDLGFLDHSTRAARLAACRQEVALNRRLAPDVYLGVLDILGPDGQLCDHLVAMRRLPDDRRLARLVERGDDLDDTLRAIAHLVATLHAGSTHQPGHDAEARCDAVRQRWTDGFDQLRPLTASIPDPDRLDRTEALVNAYLDGRAPLFDARIDQGWIRDGHGDLQAEDIFVLDDGPRILDCIEFGDEYRWGDVLADVAFLAMDLERLGRADLGARFLALHRELTADRWPTSLAHHDVAYRAHVRAKVTILRHHQHGEPAGPEASALIDLALRHLQAGRIRLVLVGGLPGTGKSTLAAGLADRLGAVLLRSDEVRLRMPDTAGPGGAAGGATVGADGADPADRYRPEAVAAVYREMLDEAQRLLGLGEHVVLDATWGDATERDLARRVAAHASAALTELVCTLPAEDAAARIRRRLQLGDDPSEATTAVAAALAHRFAPWPEAVVVPTDGPPDRAVADAMIALNLPAET